MIPLLLAIVASAAVFLLARGFFTKPRSEARRRMDAVMNTAADVDAQRAKNARRNAMGALGKKADQRTEVAPWPG